MAARAPLPPFSSRFSVARRGFVRGKFRTPGACLLRLLGRFVELHESFDRFGQEFLPWRRYPGLALFHPLVALPQERLGLGVLLLAQERSAQQAQGVIAQPVVGQLLLTDSQALPEDWLGRDVLLLLQQVQAQRCQR